MAFKRFSHPLFLIHGLASDISYIQNDDFVVMLPVIFIFHNYPSSHPTYIRVNILVIKTFNNIWLFSTNQSKLIIKKIYGNNHKMIDPL
jgi:hypothetical protein